MSRFLTHIAATVILAGLSWSAHAQEAVFGGALQPRIVEGEAQAPRGAFFIGGYTSSTGTEKFDVQFYSVRDPEDHRPEGVPYTSIPVARRVLETGDGSGSPSWADGRECGALYGVLYEFERLTPPRFHVPVLQAPPNGASRLGGPLSIHAPVVSAWGYARQADGAPMSMMLTGTDGLIIRWARFADEQLAPCWSSEAPVFSRGRPEG